MEVGASPKNRMCSNSSNWFDEKHPINQSFKLPNKKKKKIKLEINEHELFLQEALVLVSLHLLYL